MNEEIEIRLRETTEIGMLRAEEEKGCKLINDEIRKTNKKISDVQVNYIILERKGAYQKFYKVDEETY